MTRKNGNCFGCGICWPSYCSRESCSRFQSLEIWNALKTTRLMSLIAALGVLLAGAGCWRPSGRRPSN